MQGGDAALEAYFQRDLPPLPALEERLELLDGSEMSVVEMLCDLDEDSMDDIVSILAEMEAPLDEDTGLLGKVGKWLHKQKRAVQHKLASLTTGVDPKKRKAQRKQGGNALANHKLRLKKALMNLAPERMDKFRFEGLDEAESADTLKKVFPKLDDAKAKRVQAILKTRPIDSAAEDAMEKLDGLVGGHGVEVIRGDGPGGYWPDAVALYVNMGDTYDTTILYDVHKERFSVMAWGDFVERNQRRYNIECVEGVEHYGVFKQVGPVFRLVAVSPYPAVSEALAAKGGIDTLVAPIIVPEARGAVLAGVTGAWTCDDLPCGPLDEASPPGFYGLVRVMQERHGFTTKKSHALAWTLFKKGAKPHYKPEKGKAKYKAPEKWAKGRAKKQAAKLREMLGDYEVTDAELEAVCDTVSFGRDRVAEYAMLEAVSPGKIADWCAEIADALEHDAKWVENGEPEEAPRNAAAKAYRGLQPKMKQIQEYFRKLGDKRLSFDVNDDADILEVTRQNFAHADMIAPGFRKNMASEMRTAAAHLRVAAKRAEGTTEESLDEAALDAKVLGVLSDLAKNPDNDLGKDSEGKPLSKGKKARILGVAKALKMTGPGKGVPVADTLGKLFKSGKIKRDMDDETGAWYYVGESTGPFEGARNAVKFKDDKANEAVRKLMDSGAMAETGREEQWRSAAREKQTAAVYGCFAGKVRKVLAGLGWEDPDNHDAFFHKQSKMHVMLLGKSDLGDWDTEVAFFHNPKFGPKKDDDTTESGLHLDPKGQDSVNRVAKTGTRVVSRSDLKVKDESTGIRVSVGKGERGKVLPPNATSKGMIRVEWEDGSVTLHAPLSVPTQLEVDETTQEDALVEGLTDVQKGIVAALPRMKRDVAFPDHFVSSGYGKWQPAVTQANDENTLTFRWMRGLKGAGLRVEYDAGSDTYKVKSVVFNRGKIITLKDSSDVYADRLAEPGLWFPKSEAKRLAKELKEGLEDDLNEAVVELLQEDDEDTTVREIVEAATSKVEPDGEALKKHYTQWIKSGNTFQPTGDLTLQERLQKSAYRVDMTFSGPVFTRVRAQTDELYKFPNSTMDKVVAEISKFWGLKEDFKKLGLLHNRGILVYGPPGTGKSCLFKQVAEMMVERGDVVFFAKSISAVREGLKAFREVEPNRQVVVILEDADEYVGYSERDMLQLMDGEESQDNVVYLASTNYIDRFPPRLLRPGRFDKKIFLGTPSNEARRVYLMHKLKGLAEDDAIDNLVSKTEGLSFGHLRELIVGAYALKEPLGEVLARLRDLPAPEKLKTRAVGKMIEPILKDRPMRESLDESLLEASDAVSMLTKFVLNDMTQEYVAQVARPVALYKARGTYESGKAHKLALHLVMDAGAKYHKKHNKGAEGAWHSIFTPEIREQVQKALKAQAEKDAAARKWDSVLPAKWQKGGDGDKKAAA